MKKLETVALLASFMVFVTVSGCGFKSDLYLSDKVPDSLPEMPELPPLPAVDELSDPGVPVEIPPLESVEPKDKKKK